MKTRKAIALLVLFFCLTVAMQAQEQKPKKNELTVSYGQCGIILDPAISGLPDEIGYGPHDGTYSGNIGIQYLRTVHRRIAVGGLLTYEHGSIKAPYPKDEGGFESVTNYHNYFNLMGVAKFMWFNKKNVGMYTKLGFGVYLETAKGKPVYTVEVLPSLQISAIGIEAGTRNIRAFAEFGYGLQGIAIVGLKVNI